jgi:hypothetical protein
VDCNCDGSMRENSNRTEAVITNGWIESLYGLAHEGSLEMPVIAKDC